MAESRRGRAWRWLAVAALMALIFGIAMFFIGPPRRAHSGQLVAKCSSVWRVWADGRPRLVSSGSYLAEDRFADSLRIREVCDDRRRTMAVAGGGRWSRLRLYSSALLSSSGAMPIPPMHPSPARIRPPISGPHPVGGGTGQSGILPGSRQLDWQMGKQAQRHTHLEIGGGRSVSVEAAERQGERESGCRPDVAKFRVGPGLAPCVRALRIDDRGGPEDAALVLVKLLTCTSDITASS